MIIARTLLAGTPMNIQYENLPPQNFSIFRQKKHEKEYESFELAQTTTHGTLFVNSYPDTVKFVLYVAGKDNFVALGFPPSKEAYDFQVVSEVACAFLSELVEMRPKPVPIKQPDFDLNHLEKVNLFGLELKYL